MPGAAVAHRQIPGRGVGLVAARDIDAGETVVAEHALLVGVSEEFRRVCCASCLAHGAATPCPGCGEVVLCDACIAGHRGAGPCSDPASPWQRGVGHGAVVCAAERVASAWRPPLSAPDRERLRFLGACAELRRAHVVNGDARARARLDAVLRLCPDVGPAGEGIDPREASAAERVRPALEAAVQATIATTEANTAGGGLLRAIAGDVVENAALLAKETKNAFGVMAVKCGDGSHSNDDSDDDRRVRGGAVYELASRVNHACFPNVARFDNFDGVLGSPSHEFHVPSRDGPNPPGPTELRLVAIDKIPAGCEVLMSYLPVSEPCARRRRRLRNTFGFECECERCVLERAWATEDGAATGDEREHRDASRRAREARDEASELEADAAADALDREWNDAEETAIRSLDAAELARRAVRIPATYALWFARNMCPVDGCGGTLAPPHATADHMTCNYCGRRRGDDEFFRRLETGAG